MQRQLVARFAEVVRCENVRCGTAAWYNENVAAPTELSNHAMDPHPYGVSRGIVEGLPRPRERCEI